MIISHARRFIIFPDPLGQSDDILRAFRPWSDQIVVQQYHHDGNTPFYFGMTPLEAEWACDASGFAFRNYLRIAIVQNPYARMAALYQRIRQTDTYWQLRDAAGMGPPRFARWLKNVHADGLGAGHRTSPSWRRVGAWSAKLWCHEFVTHTVRLEAIEDDFANVLSQLGIAPGFDAKKIKLIDDDDWRALYDAASADIIADRYGWDLAQYGYSHLRLVS